MDNKAAHNFSMNLNSQTKNINAGTVLKRINFQVVEFKMKMDHSNFD